MARKTIRSWRRSVARRMAPEYGRMRREFLASWGGDDIAMVRELDALMRLARRMARLGG